MPGRAVGITIAVLSERSVHSSGRIPSASRDFRPDSPSFRADFPTSRRLRAWSKAPRPLLFRAVLAYACFLLFTPGCGICVRAANTGFRALAAPKNTSAKKTGNLRHLRRGKKPRRGCETEQPHPGVLLAFLRLARIRARKSTSKKTRRRKPVSTSRNPERRRYLELPTLNPPTTPY